MDVETRMREVEREIISRRPEHSVDLALDRMAELVGLLGDPQRACPVIHITGTNGKTSTARMTDALLRARGLRTGRFTSPHLVSIRERIVVDGVPISPESSAWAQTTSVSPVCAAQSLSHSPSASSGGLKEVGGWSNATSKCVHALVSE